MLIKSKLDGISVYVNNRGLKFEWPNKGSVLNVPTKTINEKNFQRNIKLRALNYATEIDTAMFVLANPKALIDD